MSSTADLRRMREEKYARARAARGAADAVPARPATAPTAPTAARSTGTPTTAPVELCGHRNMGGRTCTREQGHAAKSHRYS